MRRWFVPILALTLLLPACASAPARDRAVLSAAFVDQQLSLFQDTERRICNQVLYDKLVAEGTSLTTPIKECTGPLAESAQLTTAKHQEIAGNLAKAFALQRRLVLVLRTWQPGQAEPSEVAPLQQLISQVLTAAQGLAPGGQTAELIAAAQKAVEEVQKIISAIRG